MNNSLRLTIFAVGAIAVVAIIVAFALSGSDSDDDPGLVTNPTATTAPSATARPTVTPVPPPTNTPGPIPTITPRPSPTPPPTATPTPPPPDSHVQEMARLIFDQGVQAANLRVASIAAAEWPNESLGCPDPGIFYDTQGAPFSGFIYVLSDGSSSWEYHVSEDDSVIIRCNEIEPAADPTVNIGLEAVLRLTESAFLMRRNFTTDLFEEVSLLTSADATRLINIFYSDVALSKATECSTVFRLDFQTPEGTHEIEFMCSDNKNAAQVFWKGLEGRAPVIGKIIGPYFTGGPIPALPTANP